MQILQAHNDNFFAKYLLPFLILFWTYFSPTVQWIVGVGFFIAMDLILRIILCLRNDIPVMSSKIWRTAGKFFAASIFIIVGYVTQRFFAPDMPFMKITGSFLILAELKSIDEKAKEFTGYSLFSLIVDKIIPKKNQ